MKYVFDAGPPSEEPAWLTSIKPSALPTPLPLRKLLKNSLYYPASGTDEKPVSCFGKLIFSYVYADYAVSRDRLSVEVQPHCFDGYEPIASRSVAEAELAPRGWKLPDVLPNDGDPQKYRDAFAVPYAMWFIFGRKPNYPVDHGPARFSLLFLCADGVATYAALYKNNHIAPRAITIIRPGTGFGLNWTDFTDQDKALGRAVLTTAHAPEMLFCEGSAPVWPSYSEPLGSWHDGEYSVWRKP